jgi:hypothetical protein
LCPGSFKIAGLELNRPWKPRWTVHPRVDAHEETHLQVHSEQQSVSTRVEIELVRAIRAASVHDLETVPVGRLFRSSVPVGCEGVADEFAMDASWRPDREFEWGCRGSRAYKNLGAAFSKCLFDAGDDIASA